MKKFICGIEVDVERRNVKNIRIKIDREGQVSLTIPNRCSENAGVDFFIAKLDWVKNKLNQKPTKRHLDFKNCETVYILGKIHSVSVVPSKTNKSVLKDNEVVFYTKDTSNDALKNQYEKLLKRVLLLKSKEYFEKWESITGLKGSSLSIRKTVSRWGSCNSLTGAINLSLYLACLPEFCLDYVVLHELCHLKYANHGEYFKRELSKYMSNWKEIRKFLKDQSNTYLYI
ncbi:MAG: M48 family metallopeptidase [Clostridia bacterium]|nr:M48 family metallopeptidase [Clostridia bacterium]